MVSMPRRSRCFALLEPLRPCLLSNLGRNAPRSSGTTNPEAPSPLWGRGVSHCCLRHHADPSLRARIIPLPLEALGIRCACVARTSIRRTSRTHRERSSSSRSKSTAGEASGTESESTVAQATENMSRDELIALAHRHQSYASPASFEELAVPKPSSRRPWVEEVDDEEDLISFDPLTARGEGPSKKKGKGIDPEGAA
ncbi:hypothetical protein DFH06DRAFT_1219271 [Mycena polygramma]|nr:hypothetical protein DFH06DRAFT_1219271 [Mycena polygramma]